MTSNFHGDWFGELGLIDGKVVDLTYVDEHGQPVARTPITHPYCYDGFVVWRSDKKAKCTGTIYSDRLLQWDFDKHDRLCQKHFGNRGQYWRDRAPKLIEAFLRDWTGNPNLRLILVMEYCNQASGYPCWRFDYADK